MYQGTVAMLTSCSLPSNFASPLGGALRTSEEPQNPHFLWESSYYVLVRSPFKLKMWVQSWSLTSLQQRLFKTGGRLIRHARYFILQLAESHLTQTLFGQILGRIERLAWHPT